MNTNKNMIVMNDFKKEYKALAPMIDRAIKRSLTSGWYILGEESVRFEKEFAQYIGTKYCIGVANGLEALQIALLALGIGSGDEVITVSNSAVATSLAITNVGATPVFVDVDEYYHMDSKLIEKKITKRTKAIIPVHLFGQTVDIQTLQKIARKHKLHIVEDACQAHGAEMNGKKAGSFGTLAAFSFYPTKNLGAYGDGGAIVTNSKKLYELCKMLRNYGQKNRYYHQIKGINSRLDEIQAAILTEKLSVLDEAVAKRNAIATRYLEKLQGISQIKLPMTRTGAYHAFHLFVIEAENRDKLLQYLHENNVQAIIHYPVPIHKQACYSEFNRIPLPRTEKLAGSVISLPIHPYMTTTQVDKVAQTIKAFYGKEGKK